MIPRKIIHLLSGGLDSVTMLYYLKHLGDEVHCLLFDYGQRHKQELEWAKYHAKVCGCMFTKLDLPTLGGLNEESYIVPNRNAIFLATSVWVAHKANADTITIGCNLDDAAYFPDCREEFLEAFNKATRLAGYEVEICAPFIHKKKWEIGGMAREYGIKTFQTWSCYKGGSAPCGVCPACEKAKQAERVS